MHEVIQEHYEVSEEVLARDAFWSQLERQQEWLTEPVLAWPEDMDDSVYVMQTKPGFVFDDAFWAVFQRFPFRVCHVSYFGPERSEDSSHEERMAEQGIFEIRFVWDDSTPASSSPGVTNWGVE